MQPPRRTSNSRGCSNSWRIDRKDVATPTYRGRELNSTYWGRQSISPSVALEHTAWRATSSTRDQFQVKWRHPKDLHVKARLIRSCDVPKNEDMWATRLVSTRDRSTVAVTTTDSASCPPRRSAFSASSKSSDLAFLPLSSAATTTPSEDIFGLFVLCLARPRIVEDDDAVRHLRPLLPQLQPNLPYRSRRKLRRSESFRFQTPGGWAGGPSAAAVPTAKHVGRSYIRQTRLAITCNWEDL